MYDALVLSDLHFGSANCQARTLEQFLGAVHRGRLRTRRLILNGDVFDSLDFRRLRPTHWQVLSLLRDLSDHTDVLWVAGNHEGPAEQVGHLLGVAVRDQVVVPSGGRHVLVLHGHQFDGFCERYPVTTHVADWAYRGLQWLDPSHRVARAAKHTSKTFLRCARVIQAKAVEYAAGAGCDAVCCGHTHLPAASIDGPVHYFNSGCWTERPCHYLAVRAGTVELIQYHDGDGGLREGAAPARQWSAEPAFA